MQIWILNPWGPPSSHIHSHLFQWLLRTLSRTCRIPQNIAANQWTRWSLSFVKVSKPWYFKPMSLLFCLVQEAFLEVECSEWILTDKINTGHRSTENKTVILATRCTSIFLSSVSMWLPRGAEASWACEFASQPLLLGTYVTFSALLNLSEPQFPFL